MVNTKLVQALIVIAFYLGLYLMYAGTAHAEPRLLQVYASKLGVKAPIETVKAIDKAAILFGISPQKMVSIAVIESHMNHRSLNVNKNGTKDIGLFQINTVIMETECLEFNIFNLQGNAMCAAKLLKGHRSYANSDSQWIGRYHSRTPSRKAIYVRKLAELERRAY